MNKLSIISVLFLFICLFIIPCVCFADAISLDKPIDSVYVKIEAPTIGETLPSTVELNSQYTMKSIKWFDSNDKVVSSTATASSGQYKAFVEITKSGAGRFTTKTSVYVNGSTSNVEKDVTTLTANYLRISWICNAKASSENKTDVTAEATPTATPIATPTATPTVAPTATPTITPTATPTITPTATPTITPTATPTVEKKWANKFEIEIAEPKVGEKPAITAKALNDEFIIKDIYWTAYHGNASLDLIVTRFEEGYNYGVKIMVSVQDGYDLRSDYYGMVNGNQAEMPVDYDKDNFYVWYLFKMKEEVKDNPVNWSNASNWATEELNKANEISIIPSIFDNEDLTKNITRKEFAYVAVKLYERISGKEAIQEQNNPFKDTDDVEILKAYKVGITQGTSATTFDPNTLITREQMATMMTRALQKASIDTEIDLDIVAKYADDDEMSSWAKESVYFMSAKEIIKGVGDNKFGVKGNATREQSILIASRSAEKFAK